VIDGVTVDALHDICERYDLVPERFWAAREDHDERAQFADFHAGKRGRYDDVDAITDLPGPRGVVSNNHHTTIGFVLEFFDLEPLFDTYHGRSKTVESLRLKKPDTHYLDRALDDLGAESALYVGDSGHDVLAAERAGLDSVFVRRPHCADTDLPVAATHEVADLYGVAALLGR
jgi:phosphoglycolate phosphatase